MSVKSLFHDPKNPHKGKGDWTRKHDKKKVAETMDRITGGKEYNHYQKNAGKTTYRY